MKIICIGRNYADHARELNNPLPTVPVFFMKPESSIIINNNPFFLPDFSNEVHYEAEIILRVIRLGKNIEKQFAHRYYQEVGIGIDFTARDLQRECMKEGQPWEIAKSFDGSAVLGKFIKKEKLPDPGAISFQLELNGEIVQKGNTKDMIFSFDDIIAYVSKFSTLKMGDLIFTGTPAGVGPVKINDHLVGSVEGQVLLDFMVK
ncbi:MAG: fumarylacetoacetate hydrolase family protein [Bacteroidales bacterium]|nr:fumarylacetoacetate hydrolase family protein [Bacteroidales bacterium]MBN2762185.1 fumarylacetoacetate hydrolase family protein [Bacteroidales bacterium]